MRKWRIFSETEASQVAEAAAVLPVMFMVFLAIFWFGRAYNIYGTINHAAREGARAAVVGSCATCGNAPLNANAVAAVVASALQASKLNPALVADLSAPYNHCNGTVAQCQKPTSGPQICYYNSVVINQPNTGPPSCGVVVSFTYPYQFYLPFTSLNGPISLKATVQMAGEY